MKYQFFENKKRELFLSRLSRIFMVNRQTAENIVKVNSVSSLRINPLKISDKDGILEFLNTNGIKYYPVEWCENAYFLDGSREIISSSTYFDNGEVYLQNASSFIPVLTLDPQKGEKILDMCAAPGGKTTHIAALTNNNSFLWVNDSSYARMVTMKRILEKYGVITQSILNLPAETMWNSVEEKFDKILLDAQCSGEGMLNLNHPRALQYWSVARINKFHSLQMRMIDSAYNLLNSGGTIVYSTCTYAPEENEVVIDYFLSKHRDMEIEKINLDIPTRIDGLTKWNGKNLNLSIKDSVRILPTSDMEGFFVCKLKKK